MRILIIEDDPDIIESLEILFEVKWDGATVISADKGKKGIELIRANPPDVVILDLGLPDMDGFEVLRQIRDFSDVPIIILTARNEERDKVKGLESGANDYITKPFSPTEFLARIQAMLCLGHSLEELKFSDLGVRG